MVRTALHCGNRYSQALRRYLRKIRRKRCSLEYPQWPESALVRDTGRWESICRKQRTHQDCSSESTSIKTSIVTGGNCQELGDGKGFLVCFSKFCCRGIVEWSLEIAISVQVSDGLWSWKADDLDGRNLRVDLCILVNPGEVAVVKFTKSQPILLRSDSRDEGADEAVSVDTDGGV